MKMDVAAATQLVYSTTITCVQTGVTTAQITKDVLPNINAFWTSVKAGASAANAIKLASQTTSVITTGTRASVSLGTGIAQSMEGVNFAKVGGQTVVNGVASTASTVSKLSVTLGVLGSFVAIGDAIFSWVVGNPKRNEVNAMIAKIDESLPKLKTIAKQYGVHA